MYLTIKLRTLLSYAAILLVVLIPTALFLQGSRTPALETAAWGLSFQRPGQAPVANATADELNAYDAKFMGDPQEKTLYLTFDCGYEAGYTERILDVLASHQVKAAFFVVGNYIESQPNLIRRMVQDGHIVGNHTWSHPDMSAISDKQQFSQELQKTADAYEACTGETMLSYYRPPQGIYSQENLTMAKELGYRTVFWSLAYVDWDQNQQPTENFAMDKLTSRIHDGAVILLHSTSSTNAEILDRLLTEYENMGYEFETLEELFEH